MMGMGSTVVPSDSSQLQRHEEEGATLSGPAAERAQKHLHGLGTDYERASDPSIAHGTSGVGEQR